MLTEPLLSSLGEGWVEQNQMLAIEQRMVRAEVVFLGGGEVQDEVEGRLPIEAMMHGCLDNHAILGAQDEAARP